MPVHCSSPCVRALAFACQSKACAPPPVGSGGSRATGSAPAARKPRALPAGGGSASTAEEALQKSIDAEVKMANSTYVGEETFRGIVSYTEQSHGQINTRLRELRGRRGPSTSLNKAENEVVKMVDKAFDKASVQLTEPVKVYRGTLLDSYDLTVNESDLPDTVLKMFREGAEFVDYGFGSTSIDKGIADQFTNPRYMTDAEDIEDRGRMMSIRMEITLPKGTRVLAGRPEEKELILPRGTKYRVIKSSNNGDDVTVHLEVIG